MQKFYRYSMRLAMLIALLSLTASASMAQLQISVLGTRGTGTYRDADPRSSEIPAYDPTTKRLFVVNPFAGGFDVLDLTNPSAPTFLFSKAIVSGTPNSVAVKNGVLAVAVENTTKTSNGRVDFFATNFSSSDAPLSATTVGALPDMLTFTPDGTKLLVANEGEPDFYGGGNIDPEGSVSIITFGGTAVSTANVASATESKITFTDLNGTQATLNAAGVRIFGPSATVAQDLEPEYIVCTNDTAWVVCQENNAMALIRLSGAPARIGTIFPLGFKDHGIAANSLDPSDQGGTINIRSFTGLRGMYQPDGMALYTVNGRIHVLTANEGDARDYTGFVEESRVATASSNIRLDPPSFGGGDTSTTGIKLNTNLGRLTVTRTLGHSNAPNLNTASDVFTNLFAFGARSFSIWNFNGAAVQQVYDSGNELETRTASALPSHFNASNANSALKNRSDDKGPEPESVALATLGDSVYAFIGLERVGGIMVYNVTNPAAPYFVQYLNNRNFTGVAYNDAGMVSGTITGPAPSGRVGDSGPEGVLVIPASESPNGEPLLVVANEVSGTTTVYQLSGRVARTAQNVTGTGLVNFNSADNTTGVRINIASLTGSGNLVVSRFNTSPSNVSFGGAAPLNISRYRWNITADPSITAISATVQFRIAEIPNNGIFVPGTVSVFSRPTLGSGSFGTAIPGVTFGGGDINVPVTGFSEFVFGSGADNPLPVELSSFTGNATPNGARLQWTTQSERNNAGFTVLRDNQEIASYRFSPELRGKGTTSNATTYSFLDGGVETGKSYTYKLRSFDLDGAAHDYAQTVSVEVREPVQARVFNYDLSQNFPNPFNPTTSIKYSVAQSGNVSLKVYDLLGREVLTLVNQVQAAGEYQVSFDASSLAASGVYIYRLQSGNFTRTMKMLLVK